ncbi:MAG TPA: hypothetical protein VF316_05070 [Polyangiaceae bacterium]
MKPTLHLDLLRAVLRCHRYRRPADLAALELRVDASAAQLRGSLRLLEQAGMVRRLPSSEEVRLTFEGFAVAVASLPGARKRNRSTQKRAA